MEQMPPFSISQARRASLAEVNMGIPDSPTLPSVTPVVRESCIPFLNISDDDSLLFPYQSSVETASSLLAEFDDVDAYSTTTTITTGESTGLYAPASSNPLTPNRPSFAFRHYGYPSPPPTFPPPPIPELIPQSAFSSYSSSSSYGESDEDNDYIKEIDPFLYDRPALLSCSYESFKKEEIKRMQKLPIVEVSEVSLLLSEGEKEDIGSPKEVVGTPVQMFFSQIFVWKLVRSVWDRVRNVFKRRRELRH